jgi:hypothetical protein
MAALIFDLYCAFPNAVIRILPGKRRRHHKRLAFAAIPIK